MQNKAYVRLERDLFEIKTKNGIQYGGNQTLFENPAISAGGCGVIGAANVLCYLKGIQPDESQYNGMCTELYKKYIRVSRRFGITGLGLVYGLNRAFAAYGMAYRAKWCMSMKKLEERIYSMLENDIPVIISAGPALPWRKKSAVTLFCRDGDKLVAKAAMRSHYVTVTAADVPVPAQERSDVRMRRMRLHRVHKPQRRPQDWRNGRVRSSSFPCTHRTLTAQIC